MRNDERINRCQGRTKSGDPCHAAATAGGLCFFHANPNKASELGRIGGRSRRHADAKTAEALPKLDNASAMQDALNQLIADVYSGRLHPRVAAGLAPLLNLQLRAIETAALEHATRGLAAAQSDIAPGHAGLDGHQDLQTSENERLKDPGDT